MSNRSDWNDLRTRAAGKWQLPLFLFAAGLLVTAWLRLNPSPTRMAVPDAVRYLDALLSAGVYDEAIRLGDALLARDDLSGEHVPVVHLGLAQAKYEYAVSQGLTPAHAGRQIVEHFRTADERGRSISARDYERLGHALEWQRRFGDAVDAYNRSVDLGALNELDLRRRVIVLRRDELDSAPAALDALLDELLVDLDDRDTSLRLWALGQKLRVLNDLNRLGEAATLLARNERAFHGTALGRDFQYLEALLLYYNGHFDEAETLLRAVRNGLSHNEPLHARTGWLLGEIVMSDGGPQRPVEALSFFEDVIRYHGSGPYVTASRVGSGLALAMQRRHDEAIEAFQTAIDELGSLTERYPVDIDSMRVTLGVLADSLERDGQLEAGLAYSRLAASLIDPANVELATLVLQQSAQIEAALADKWSGPDRWDPDVDLAIGVPRSAAAREAYAAAAHRYLELAKVNAVNEERAADAVWQAAELFARSGSAERAAGLYRMFATERPAHSLVPRALLRIGQLHYGAGEWSDAVGAFQECYRRFPRTLDGARALIPLARAFMAMGPGENELAERTLRIVLEESEVFTPAAPEFASALFLLGDLLVKREAFAEAIAVLEEALQRYPNDERAARARYMLAEALRRSGLALKSRAARTQSEGEIALMRAEAAARFEAARGLYHELIDYFELRGGADLRPVEALYRRHASFYEADCLFETQDYQAARKLYEEAAAIYKDHPSALAAYVQIVNCNAFLGRSDEARAALARGLVLVDAMPQEAFEDSVSPETRRDWKRYFDWLGSSGLF
jgi:TolA-binding protein